MLGEFHGLIAARVGEDCVHLDRRVFLHRGQHGDRFFELPFLLLDAQLLRQ